MPSSDQDHPHGGGPSRFIFLIRIIPTIQVVLDSLVLLLCGYVSYYALVYYSFRTADYYTLAICFHWLLTLMLMYFAGLYHFESVVRAEPDLPDPDDCGRLHHQDFCNLFAAVDGNICFKRHDCPDSGTLSGFMGGGQAQ
jgi:hypothetical protein